MGARYLIGQHGAMAEAAAPRVVSEIFDPEAWRAVPGFEDLTDITYHRAVDARHGAVAFDRPEVRNAFRPHTVDELYRALDHARHEHRRRVRAAHRQRPVARGRRLGVLLRRRPAHPRARTATSTPRARPADDASTRPAPGRLHILEVQRLIRFMPKVVICVVPGWAAGGGHCLHVVCDLTLASRRARPLQADRRRRRPASTAGSARPTSPARSARSSPARSSSSADEYSAEDMHRMGMVNAVVAHADLEAVGAEWGREINGKSPTAQRMLKFAFNLIDDGLVGQQVFAGEATRLAYMTDEAVEGRDSFLEKRDPDWSPYPYYF